MCISNATPLGWGRQWVLLGDLAAWAALVLGLKGTWLHWQLCT